MGAYRLLVGYLQASVLMVNIRVRLVYASVFRIYCDVIQSDFALAQLFTVTYGKHSAGKLEPKLSDRLPVEER